MRICYIADGASIHTQRRVNYFARKGHETHLICWNVMPAFEGKEYFFVTHKSEYSRHPERAYFNRRSVEGEIWLEHSRNIWTS